MTSPPVRRDSDEAIRIGDKSAADQTRWGMLLVLFMRLIAALWMVQGLSQWRVILSVDGVLLDRVSGPVGISVIAFAVADLVAAIGLWLAAPWGGVLWILVTFAQIVVAIALPDFFEGGRLVVALDSLLIALYLFLTFKAASEGEPVRPLAPARSGPRPSLLARLSGRR